MKKRNSVCLNLIITVIAFAAFALGGCDIGRRYDNEGVIDNVVLLRNKLYKKSLAAYCEWDGDENNKEFTVPDEYCGYKVKCLGKKGNPGFTGNPRSFMVVLPDVLNGLTQLTRYAFEPYDKNAENTIEIEFIVNIGKSFNEFVEINKTSLYGFGEINDDGRVIVKAYYNITTHFNVDIDNSTFYSKDGDIYYKSSGKMVEYSYL